MTHKLTPDGQMAKEFIDGFDRAYRAALTKRGVTIAARDRSRWTEVKDAKGQSVALFRRRKDAERYVAPEVEPTAWEWRYAVPPGRAWSLARELPADFGEVGTPIETRPLYRGEP